MQTEVILTANEVMICATSYNINNFLEPNLGNTNEVGQEKVLQQNFVSHKTRVALVLLVLHSDNLLQAIELEPSMPRKVEGNQNVQYHKEEIKL